MCFMFIPLVVLCMIKQRGSNKFVCQCCFKSPRTSTMGIMRDGRDLDTYVLHKHSACNQHKRYEYSPKSFNRSQPSESPHSCHNTIPDDSLHDVHRPSRPSDDDHRARRRRLKDHARTRNAQIFCSLHLEICYSRALMELGRRET